MNLYLVILCIAACCVVITDYLGFFDELETLLGKRLGYKIKFPKPINCSTCEAHLIGLLYLIISGQWTIWTYLYLLLISASTPLIENLLRNMIDAAGIIINLPMTFLK